MAPRAWPDEYRTVLVCVDSYQNGNLQGRLYPPFSDEGPSFKSLSQFIAKMEQILDSIDFPKAYTITRTFSPPPEKPPASHNTTYKDGALASFALRILFRQNASWQGSITWMEGKQEQSFRSTLELIFLMNSALEYQKAS